MINCALFPSLSPAPDRPLPATGPAGGRLAPWPGPHHGQLPEGGCVLSATSPRPDVVVVRAIGEIDLASGPALGRTLAASRRILARDQTAPHRPRLVCDLSPVTFFGATGLSTLVEAADDADADAVDLRVVAEQRAVRRPLELTGVATRLTLDATLAAATADIAQDLDDWSWRRNHDRNKAR